jgi:hypothetical protein
MKSITSLGGTRPPRRVGKVDASGRTVLQSGPAISLRGRTIELVALPRIGLATRRGGRVPPCARPEIR